MASPRAAPVNRLSAATSRKNSRTGFAGAPAHRSPAGISVITPAAAAIDLSYTSAGHYTSLGGAAATASPTTDDDDATSASGDIQAYTFRVQTWVKEIAGANDTTDTAGYSDVTVKLDAYYPGIGKGSWMIIVTDGATLPVEVSKAVPSYYPSSSDTDAFKVRSLQVTALVEQGSALDLAKGSYQAVPGKFRSHSTLTLSIAEPDFRRIREEITSLRKRILELARNSPAPDRVYQVTFNVFPLSRYEGI